MQDFAEGMCILAVQAQGGSKIKRSASYYQYLMEEVVDFIDKWLESRSGAYSTAWDRVTTQSLVAAKHILVVPRNDQVIGLWKKLNTFAQNFDRDFLVEIRAVQDLIFVPDI